MPALYASTAYQDWMPTLHAWTIPSHSTPECSGYLTNRWDKRSENKWNMEAFKLEAETMLLRLQGQQANRQESGESTVLQ